MSTAPRYIPSYTVADYQQWEGDWELWQGIPVAMTPSPFGKHQHCCAQLVRALGNAIDASECRAVVLPEIDWVISNDTVVRPDIVVLCGDVPAGHVTETPAVVVEILSASTADRDRNDKRRMYQEQGVDWYLIVDPASGLVRGLKRSEDGQFTDSPVGETLALTICGTCELEVDLKSLST